nr:immunoglobulin heavy chain junction region [Macaca mulatta]MPN70191.1 immunoglobulin heavy chain junction region [Macaca mulatta]MPN71062.1 immunoglobulin heavy chain junction region [Macaca mulatta]MPN71343.1 immunoglobulin heavy chain junction region [Macaca mulatta]MPN71845.1 immunoglobulin heavy chain junction region [Macaca mulatta]
CARDSARIAAAINNWFDVW